jgi:hypothetical protein
MAEQVFKSPGFFEREVDLTQRTTQIEGIPAGIIGTSKQGPAFVPVTLGSYTDFERKFGPVSSNQYGPFAVKEWLKNRTAITYIRVLGAGYGAETSSGTVSNAGFLIKGSASSVVGDKRHKGTVQFIAAQHHINSYEVAGYPIFTDNNSFASGQKRIIRGMVFLASGAKLEILDHDQFYSLPNVIDDVGKIKGYSGLQDDGTFKLVLSSAAGASFSNAESYGGIKIYTASLNPTSKYYIANFLNTNPDLFHEEQHLLYADFPIEDEIARVTDTAQGTVALLSGSAATNGVSGLVNRDLFGRFDTRYKTARTTSFISQPFGNKEYDLFHFESLDDGEIGNKRVKVSIANLKKSTDPKKKYGEFTVLVRDTNDTDTGLRVLEQFGPCSLDPRDENYVANLIGDYKVYFNFDGGESEKRVNVEGKRPNRSSYVRIVMSDAVERRLVPEETLPFGFRGLPVIKTTDNLTDDDRSIGGGSLGARLTCVTGSQGVHGEHLSGSILPPVPFRFKTTSGPVNTSPTFTGQPGNTEIADSRYFWGIKFETVPLTGSVGDSVLLSNGSSQRNKLLDSYSKFLGVQKLDTLVTGSGADDFNNNKFTLARVCLQNTIALTSTIAASIATEITGTADLHIREAAYIRNGEVENKNYTITDTNGQRVTFATLAAATDEKFFNRFSSYAKFTNMMYGGFDGTNILDFDQRNLNDRAGSSESGGKAAGEDNARTNLSADFSPGTGKENNTINSYRTAGEIITDPFASRVNIVATPGIRDPYVTDYIGELTRDYSQAIYIMDIPSYDDRNNRIFTKNGKPNVRKTVESFAGRRLDNNYVATYFPDMTFDDTDNKSTITAPASVAALKALGYNDAVSFPWFAPAGFNRGALKNVLNSRARLNTADRDLLYEARINPIANFPNGGFVIFGQKTLQQDRSALDRVNVRRMLLQVKRIVSDIASQLIFEQNTPQTRARFVAEVTPQLSTIQTQQGIDQFKVVMDSSNNTAEDAEQNKLNGRIVLVPTRAVEFISMDFIITNSGVSFE